MFWKDPFSDRAHETDSGPSGGPRAAGVVTIARDSAAAAPGAAREPRDSEISRLRAEIAAARAEAAAARAENARLRERAEDDVADRRECVADNDARAEARMRRRAEQWIRPQPSSRGAPDADRGGAARAERALPDARRRRPSEPAMTRRSAPPAHGMIIVPLPITPPPAAACDRAGAARSRRRVRARSVRRAGAAVAAPQGRPSAFCSWARAVSSFSVACSRWKPALVAASWASDSSMPLPTPVR